MSTSLTVVYFFVVTIIICHVCLSCRHCKLRVMPTFDIGRFALVAVAACFFVFSIPFLKLF